MANPTSTITITVNSANQLVYTRTGSGGSTSTAKSHRLFRNCDLVFAAPAATGNFVIQFTGNRAPFTNNIPGKDLSVSAVAGGSTAPLTAKNNSLRRKVKYFVAVARPGNPPFISEDPEMEDGGDPGGPVRKSAKKKSSKKKPNR
jgi:hypothetical protein